MRRRVYFDAPECLPAGLIRHDLGLETEPAHDAADEEIGIAHARERRQRRAIDEPKVAETRLHGDAGESRKNPIERARGEALESARVRAVRATRVHDLVAFAPRVDEHRHDGRRMLEIAIHRDHRAAARVVQPCEQRALMSEVPSESDAADARIARGDFGDGVPGAVARPVVDEHELVVDAGRAERFGERGDERLDVRRAR